MYTIEFYEDMEGKSDLIEFMQWMRDTQDGLFYKMAAFLDFLAENGPFGDKVVCRYPEGRIYMHCIPGYDKRYEQNSASAGGRRDISDDPAVCVILYGQSIRDSLVLLHHYIADKIPGGVPLRHMYRAVRELQEHCRR